MFVNFKNKTKVVMLENFKNKSKTKVMGLDVEKLSEIKHK
jgi:hypothetical protein